ncbi:MAG TPA: hypothetical protein VNA19_16865 [Pyrinomonadaceae bacterium]|jgi:hypothetical protein|nr:hypothetical protein [Pyrinomonadaceae bacterium]
MSKRKPRTPDETQSTPSKERHDADAAAEIPNAGQILVAFEKLFGGGRGVGRFSRSGLRYVKLPHDSILIEQNPKKRSEWAELARSGRRIAWLMRDGEYLARVVDGEVVLLD